MKKSILVLSLLLISCDNIPSEFSSSTISMSTSSEETSSISSYNSSSVISINTASKETNSISSEDSFDNNLVGKWYIHSSWMDVLALNTMFEIKSDKTLTIQKIKFNYVGIYDGFEGTCMFLSESGITTFIASYDADSEVVDWAFQDKSGQQDLGIARNYEYSSGIKYDQVTNEWPMETINEYLGLNGNIPSYESTSYSLAKYDHSQVYGDVKYCMIDIFNVSDNAKNAYKEILENSGFIVSENGVFYEAYDSSKTYGVRFYSHDESLSIFVYPYDAVFKEVQ